MKFMEVQSHHKTPDNIMEMIMYIICLMLGGVGSLLGIIHDAILFKPMWLHYMFMGAQGIMYIVSAVVGGISIYKFFYKKGNPK